MVQVTVSAYVVLFCTYFCILTYSNLNCAVTHMYFKYLSQKLSVLHWQDCKFEQSRYFCYFSIIFCLLHSDLKGLCSYVTVDKARQSQ